MSAVVVRPAPIEADRRRRGEISQADYMPFSTRHKVARELNKLWEEFVGQMHDGPVRGPEVAEKFWKYVSGLR